MATSIKIISIIFHVLCTAVLSVATINTYGQLENAAPDTLKFRLEGLVKSLKTKEPIYNAEVSIAGTDTSKIILHTDSNGFFATDLAPNTSYIVVVSRDKYLNAKGKETTVGANKSLVFYHEYEMQPITNCIMLLLPVNTYIHNSTQIIPLEDSTENLFNTEYYYLSQNPNMAVEYIGFRDSIEDSSISLTRAQIMRDSLISKGISRNRIKISDGGIGPASFTEKEIEYFNLSREDRLRTLLGRVTSWEYEPK